MAAPTIGHWYRLTNAYTGSGLALDVVNDAGTSSSGTLQMASTGALSGQYWQLEYNPASSTSTYALYTQFLGETKRLDVYGNDATKPLLADAGGYTGQVWTIAPWGDGTFRLSNAFSGSNMFLDVYSDVKQPFLEGPDHIGQHWTFTLLDSQAAPHSVGPDTTRSSSSPGATTRVPSSTSPSGTSNTSIVKSPPQSAASSNSSPSGAAIVGSSGKSSSNAGAIAGGVIGGLALLGILVALAMFLRRRKNRTAHAATNYDPPASPVSKQMYQPDGQDGLATQNYQVPVQNTDGSYTAGRGW